MTEKRRGIVDPWRTVDPVRPTPAAPPHEGKKDLDDIDFDADLAVPGKYVIRSKHANFAVSSVRVATPKDALDVLADCIMAMWQIKGMGKALIELGIGVRTRQGMYNVPGEETPASRLESGESAIWFFGVTLDDGMAALARIMRSSDVQPIARKLGITPMLTA